MPIQQNMQPSVHHGEHRRQVSSKVARDITGSTEVWTIPAINVLLMRESLLAEGVSEMELLRGTGISPKHIKNNDSLLTFDQVVAFTANAARLTRKPGLGLRIGHAESPADWGVLGYAMLSCANIGEVVNAILRFHRTAGSIVDVLFSTHEDLAILDLVPVRPLRDALPCVMEEHMAATHSAFEMLAGAQVPMVRINLSYARPDHHRQYQALFRCPVYFGEPHSQLVFKANFLEYPVARSNKFSAKLARQLCSEQLARQTSESDLVQQVRYLILLQGSDFPDIESVSERLNITSRTLRNRLGRQGTSFQALLDDTRSQLAISYLQSSQMHVDEIANLLGFSDRSNFRRAFKKWTGQLPRDFR
jgi:AraC-like DNA-binding protein